MEQLRLPRRKKLGYVPGMISLLTVPFLFLYYGNKRIAEIPNYRVMELNWPGQAFHSKYLSYVNPPPRQYLDIILTGNKDSDEVRIRFGTLYVRELFSNKDSVHGLIFHFGVHSTYEEFVRLLDMPNIYDIRYFYPTDDGLKFFYRPERKHGIKIELLPPI